MTFYKGICLHICYGIVPLYLGINSRKVAWSRVRLSRPVPLSEQSFVVSREYLTRNLTLWKKLRRICTFSKYLINSTSGPKRNINYRAARGKFLVHCNKITGVNINLRNRNPSRNWPLTNADSHSSSPPLTPFSKRPTTRHYNVTSQFPLWTPECVMCACCYKDHTKPSRYRSFLFYSFIFTYTHILLFQSYNYLKNTIHICNFRPSRL